MIFKTASAALAALILLYLSSCVMIGEQTLRGTPARPTRPAPGAASATAAREKLAEGGRYVLGRKELVIRGRRFNMDCTGTVLAIYYYAGIDLTRNFDRYGGNGVSRLYKSLEAEQLLYDTELPLTGDIIFWDNTYDRNRDGRWNDPLTHVGMVMSAGEDGSIEYVHLNYRKGIIIENMNLRRPDVHEKLEKGRLRIVNSPIRMKQAGKEHPGRWLASQLYRSFGMGYLF